MKTMSVLEDAVANTGASLLRDAARDGLPQDIQEVVVPELPAGAEDKLYLALATRFIFSVLVDADSLNTEEWDKGTGRQADFNSIAELTVIAKAACIE